MTQSESPPPQDRAHSNPESAEVDIGKRKNWLFSIGTILLFFLILEILFRLYYRPLPPPHLQAFINPEWQEDTVFLTDSILFWRFIPSRTIEGRSRENGRYDIVINKDGYRGREWDEEIIDEQGDRVLVIGDSCVFGWDVPEGKNFPERLMVRLSQSPKFQDRPPILFQRGVPGYTSHQALTVLREWGPKIQPDWIVLYLGTNDCIPCVNKNDRTIAEETKEPFLQPAIQRSHAALALRDFILLVAKNLLIERDYNSTVDFQTSPARVPLDHFEENLADFVNYASDAKSRLILLTRQNATPNPRLETYNEKIREVGDAHGIPVVDVAARLVDYASSEVYAHPDWDPIHPNAKGYDLIAEWTVEAMLGQAEEQEGI
ncbi:MAG: SGNH/GDSL hydrolase family protein [Candidatus Omnitrophica bacterium]|nr:SGNH/GDSL hydrolase family protein [Candidatus Omnitrophota bacterium]